ncbi:MAG: hypothetical protein ACLRFG_02155 [Clostridia bacterium]
MKVKLKKEELVQAIRQDFANRQHARKSYEAQWQLNLNFLMGNQYSRIASNGAISTTEKQYFWQEKEVFNHIAPLVEVRSAKIAKLRPSMAVLPASTDERDMQAAKVSKDILQAVSNKIALNELTKQAIMWSEVCGTVFYKVVWNNALGNVIATDEKGKLVREGDVDVVVCSPFEIFPENLSCENIADQKSIIHAKAYHVSEVKDIWGVDVEPENVHSFSLSDQASGLGGLGYDTNINKIADIELKDHCVVIEKYEKPNVDLPNGRLTIVAGNKLLFDGDLPYINGDQGLREMPFIKQISLFMPGSFYGMSVVDRLIPIQRAYNAVRNRKHEYINRLSMGVLTVEDGSVDTDMLEEEGLSPGKVLVYRQGGKAPSIMSTNDSNTSFNEEESNLLDEFKSISGVSDLMRESYANYTNMSGVALQLLSEQDDTRISSSLDSVKNAMCEIGKYVLRLYKQFAVIPRLLKLVGENGKVEMYYWSSSEICSDDVVLDTTTDSSETIAQRRTMVLDLLKSGLLYDEEGKLSQNMRKKCLDLLGFGVWEHTQDLTTLQINYAHQENLDMIAGKVIMPTSIDDDKIHIDEHIAFMLGEDFKKAREQNEELFTLFEYHIQTHREHLAKINQQKNIKE